MRWLSSIRLTSATRVGAAHQAVCVEANHVAILAAPASAKIGDVAALAVEGQLAVSVENSVRADDLGHQPPPGEFFLEDFFLVGGVAQDKKVKMIERALTT